MKKKCFWLVLFFGFVANAQVINFPDANFKATLLSSSAMNYVAKNLNGTYFNIDSNNDGEIQESEANQVSYLNVNSASISSIMGVSYFHNLVNLYCELNQLNSVDLSGMSNLQTFSCNYNQITSLNLNGLTNLTNLNCSENQLTALEISASTNLLQLICYSNQLTSLNVSSLTNLTRLECTDNLLSSLDVGGLSSLQYLICNFNQISSINTNGLTSLTYFICGNNQLSDLNVGGLTNLQRLDCNVNQLSTLDLNANTKLINLDCSYNQLISLFIKNGKNENPLNFYSNPSLQYICADDVQLSTIQSGVNLFGYNCNVNSYCSFVPGGVFYTIQGNNKYDENTDGCDALDAIVPNLKFTITNGSVNGTIISNSLGNYSIPAQIGTHLVSPIFQNSNYFTITPPNTSVSFPANSSPAIRNFCISPNGIHNDLEIVIIPLFHANPGFNAYYKIIYSNKGTHNQSGSLNLTFDDSVEDFISASTTPTSQAVNTLTWSFSNLEPFESRIITLVMNLNSPTEIPALNGGSILNYSASVTGLTDETPIDNEALLNQEVVNSFDPNDKTCLEGTTITPDKVGEYVHYMIRFENTGTANAQNIVVKDVIDTAKFDVTTLVPIDGSHNFYTRITNTNQVEFIFENIQLPFDDANNDGYVAFKIKTKPTLVEGNTFSNTASIYFDYNFPIITNAATTTIQVLSNPDFEFSNYIQLTPNPAKDVLNITSKVDIEISSISIYNALGQLVIVIPNANETASIDVSQLTIGTYFMKVVSDKGSSVGKFLKQ